MSGDVCWSQIIWRIWPRYLSSVGLSEDGVKETLTMNPSSALGQYCSSNVSCEGLVKWCTTYFLGLFSSRLLSFTARGDKYTPVGLQADIFRTNNAEEAFRKRKQRCYNVPECTSRPGGEFHSLTLWAERESLWLKRSTNTAVGGAASDAPTSQLTRAVRERERASPRYKVFSCKSKQLRVDWVPSAHGKTGDCSRGTQQRLCI